MNGQVKCMLRTYEYLIIHELFINQPSLSTENST